ncbi:MAG: bifunctional (p)ppGpp synthetase/guanosine-3',5'-bis(diphosphate) 3'-pyrophosphohydrolase [Pseudomonadaceae bacterium]|nr:bifunctional (p)ppGpp synthetase/guanosine-3',5'-bis(diphosphate) 3'-pyrophosphohydrolase [Pseudomonadaceae bacterium]
MSSNRAKSSDGYFQAQLRQAAANDQVAAPASLDSLTEQLRSYLDEQDVARVIEAHDFAAQCHDGQFRRTGHAYITHPIAVASNLATMGMDAEALMAALLHDVVEDTGVSLEDLSARFGAEVATIVDGVSKLSTIFRSRAEAQAENFQKMAMAMANDIRVIMVKLCDRLHNMRTIGVMSQAQRKRIAQETLDLYAPIAGRLGMHEFKVEFEDLAFGALYPLRADRISRAVRAARGNRKAVMREISLSLEQALANEGIEAAVTSRQKHLYSIYEKMKRQRKPFGQIMDVYGYRIVVDQLDTCYRALGVIHNLYKPVSSRFKDYIAIPKANGYQSLHTSLIGMHGVPIEVQIRTEAMDRIASEGIASHWKYKASRDTDAVRRTQRKAREWVEQVVDLNQQAGDSREFVESVKTDLFPDEVYVFTPDGDILSLPRGACVVDFAYAVHTQIGNTCVGGHVDREFVPLSTQLQSGQSVSITTAPDAMPNPDWLSFVVTGKARTGIRHGLKKQHRSSSIALGRKLLNRALAQADTSIADLDFRRLRKVFTEFDMRKRDDVFEAIGSGELMAYVVAQRLLAASNPDFEAVELNQGGPVAIRGGEGLVITYARCCGPVPGDPIVGHMSRGKGLVVHLETCANIHEVRRRAANEIIPTRWAEKRRGEFNTNLLIEVKRQKGVIAELASTITDLDASIEDIHIEERSSVISSVRVELAVRSRNHLARVMRRLRNVTSVSSIRRVVA